MLLRDIFNDSVGLLVESFFQLLANKGGELLQFIVCRCFLRNYLSLVAIWRRATRRDATRRDACPINSDTEYVPYKV